MSSGLLREWAVGNVATGAYQASGVQSYVATSIPDFTLFARSRAV